ncbi:MAG TPA: DMT family transporter [Vicinamibacterales bacterium]|nr:DMT family transporter [Vicinamibacterales bacterium]
MTLIWGTNYALVKTAFRELDPQAFNALRLIEASAVMVGVNLLVRRYRPAVADQAGGEIASIFHTPAQVTGGDWLRLLWLGLVGHCLYQYLFIGGLAYTSVANGALIVASSPIVITLLSTMTGTERIGALHWAGTVLSFLGIYIVVGRGAHVSEASLRGDLMLLAAVFCWGLYTIGARPLMARHSPVGVTALSMLLGTLMYLPLAGGPLSRVAWADVSALTWIKLVYSSLFALCVAYTIWYAAVREIGSARTSAYSNLLPIVAMVTAYLWIGEPLGLDKLGGAAAVLAGVALTRLGQRRLQIPAE